MIRSRVLGGRSGSRIEAWARLGFWVLLALTWVVAVAYMWDALTTVPDADRLEESRLAAIPTPRTFFTAAIFSAMELALVLAVLWPGWTSYYASRLAVMALSLVTWFIMTTPMDISRMDWIHRRWLAAMGALIVLALVTLLTHRLVRRVAGMRT
jgi:hypothetical protein